MADANPLQALNPAAQTVIFALVGLHLAAFVRAPRPPALRLNLAWSADFRHSFRRCSGSLLFAAPPALRHTRKHIEKLESRNTAPELPQGICPCSLGVETACVHRLDVHML
jgi:hypothetical protein